MTELDSDKPRAAILRFPRKRGRPRILKPKHDTGTPELVMKRLKQETAEALDLCLERDLITPDQHWCGIHLRWLYTLRYGAPGVRAVDPTHFGGTETKVDDPEWRSAREKEYNEAIETLSQEDLAKPIVAMCIHNERPSFLRVCDFQHTRQIKTHERELSKILDGLDALVALWARGRT